jgi:hypothetical protein
MAANAVHALPREVPFRVEMIRLKTITTAPREDVAEMVAKGHVPALLRRGATAPSHPVSCRIGILGGQPPRGS